ANLPRAVELLLQQRPEPGQEDLRGFEWRYLWQLTQRDDARLTLRGHGWYVNAVAFSPDGTLLATSSVDGAIKLSNVADGEELANLQGSSGQLSFSPDGRLLAWSDGLTVKLWDRMSRRNVAIL